jgi:hypothetical protein
MKYNKILLFKKFKIKRYLGFNPIKIKEGNDKYCFYIYITLNLLFQSLSKFLGCFLLQINKN